MDTRSVERIVTGRPTSDGAGVNLIRVFAAGSDPGFDPFLMLDEFGSNDPDDYIAGFPPHPHRGFETVTYMLEGKMEHRDHLGNRGLLNDGDVQWMTAARGIVHSEMPRQTAGRMHGFQLWLNLPAAEKMNDPAYRDIPAASIPTLENAGIGIKVIAGCTDLAGEQVTGPIQGLTTDPLYLDVRLPAGRSLALPVEPGHRALLYVYDGGLSVVPDDVELDVSQLAVLGTEGLVQVAGRESGARFLLLAGKPLHEPVVQHGPFVMNTSDEIRQAIDDYQNGRLTD